MRRDNRDSRLLKAGHYAGLKFNGGWLFIQIVGTENVEVKPWILLNENENRDEIAAGTAGVNNDELEDTLNNQLLEPDDEDRNSIFQILYGVAPSRMQVFRLFGRDRNEALQSYDAPGEPGVFTNGFDSPYNNPSLESEVFHVNSMSPLRLQAYNPMDEPATAKLSLHVNKLRYTVITDKSLMKALLQGQVNARLAMMGEGIQNSDQLEAPNWIKEAFGEHMYETSEILNFESGAGNGSAIAQSGADLANPSGGSR